MKHFIHSVNTDQVQDILFKLYQGYKYCNEYTNILTTKAKQPIKLIKINDLIPVNKFL